MESQDQPDSARRRGGELGRLAGKFVKNAGPRTRQFIEESRPKVDKAIQDARPKVDKAIQDARPKVQKAVEDYRPRVEQAGRDAVKYAQDHQDEIKGLALRGARMRLGPLGMAIDALGIGAQPQQPQPGPNACTACGAQNTPAARFCSECGAQLPSREA